MKILFFAITITIFLASCKSTNNFYQGKVMDVDARPLKDLLVNDYPKGAETKTDAIDYFRLTKNEHSLASLIFSKEGYVSDTISSVYHQAGETTTYRFINEDTTIVVLQTYRSIPVDSPKPVLKIVTVGTEITGDFNGDGQVDFARQTLTKKGEGNPVENGTPDEYAILFPESALPSIPTGCCNFRLVNEGDLDGNGADELSIFQAPMNGCTYTMHTYTFKNGGWKEDLMEPFLIPTACEPFSDEVLQQRIFLENGNVYYYKTDANKDGFPLIKTPARLQ